MDKVIERIERTAGVPGLVSLLAERLSPTDLQSLLLEVYRLRSNNMSPADVLADFASNRFVRPSAVSPCTLSRWEQIAFAHLPQEFHPVALSPVCPLGTNSVVAPVNQNWAVATARNTEVVSDSTNVLALECSLRRQANLRLKPRSTEPVHLAASQRLLRAQHYENPALLAHFGTFTLCSAGRDQGNLHFEASTLKLHIHFYLASLRAFLGLGIPIRLSVTDFSSQPNQDLIETDLFPAIRSEFEEVECALDEARTRGRGYYSDLCFHIHATTISGQPLELVDGGSVNWTQKLLSNAKERLVISGIGSERLCTVFGEGCLS
jgi:hypothetical protein